jgi:hypothetical protein
MSYFFMHKGSRETLFLKESNIRFLNVILTRSPNYLNQLVTSNNNIYKRFG